MSDELDLDEKREISERHRKAARAKWERWAEAPPQVHVDLEAAAESIPDTFELDELAVEPPLAVRQVTSRLGRAKPPTRSGLSPRARSILDRVRVSRGGQ